jgi:hypothetical protein
LTNVAVKATTDLADPAVKADTKAAVRADTKAEAVKGVKGVKGVKAVTKAEVTAVRAATKADLKTDNPKLLNQHKHNKLKREVTNNATSEKSKIPQSTQRSFDR